MYEQKPYKIEIAGHTIQEIDRKEDWICSLCQKVDIESLLKIFLQRSVTNGQIKDILVCERIYQELANNLELAIIFFKIVKEIEAVLGENIHLMGIAVDNNKSEKMSVHNFFVEIID